MAEIEFNDWDEGTKELIKNIVLPEQIECIGVYHDGGRLSIDVNSVELFKRMEGTRDCSVEIRRDAKETAVQKAKNSLVDYLLSDEYIELLTGALLCQFRSFGFNPDEHKKALGLILKFKQENNRG